MSGVHVRPARDDELDAAGAVVRAAYDADGLVRPDYLAVIADARARTRDAVVAVAVRVADPDDDSRTGSRPVGPSSGEVLGSVTFALAGSPWTQLARPGQAEFRMLGVHPQARGSGVGVLLVRWCLEQARVAGAREVVLSSATAPRPPRR